MPTLDLRTLALASVTTLAFLGASGVRPVRAQNTYADVPFNQGSLFYRPSGAKPPATSSARPSASSRRPFRRWSGGPYYAQQPRAYAPAYRPAAPGYAPVAPAAPYYAYPAR